MPVVDLGHPPTIRVRTDGADAKQRHGAHLHRQVPQPLKPMPTVIAEMARACSGLVAWTSLPIPGPSADRSSSRGVRGLARHRRRDRKERCNPGEAFDPFSTTKPTGAGLGLAAVQGIVRRHGGAVSLRSALGQGGAFAFVRPRVHVVAETPDAPTPGATGAALCVLLDYSVPNMDGDQVLQELGKLPPDVRDVLTSGLTDHDLRDRLAGAGLTAFLQTPAKMYVLLETIAGSLRAAGAGADRDAHGRSAHCEVEHLAECRDRLRLSPASP